MSEPTNEQDPARSANIPEKSPNSLREEQTLTFWKEKDIFRRTLDRKREGVKDRGEFIFYEGPPTANGRPGIHHLEARAFKDAIPRYKTMQGYYVRRKGGWDTHGLPVELQVEKELGLKSKKEIEKYGIAAFNEKCKESVWSYVTEWERFTDRMGYWVDLKDPYVTYRNPYMESIWNIIRHVDDRGLLYKDYKVLPWCPRCQTALSSHELAQGYHDVKDLSVTVKFRLKIQDPRFKNEQEFPVYFLAWTTTPWTLPGNVGLAVNPKIDYVEIEKKDMGDGKLVRFILAKDLAPKIFKGQEYSVTREVIGKDLIGLEYEPLYPFLGDNISGSEREKLENAFKVYGADFVTTADGTGIVHTAVMYGQDDFELGTKVGLPKYHLVNEDGTFRDEAGFLAKMFVKDEATDVAIIKDLAGRGLLFSKEKYEHSYPFCWRCKTPLIYFARDSWYIRMSDLKKKLVKENEGIHWEPEHIKEGRFGEWLGDIKDWAISRERYWGTPLPVWICEGCGQRKVAGSIDDISLKPRNIYFVMRHGEAENNAKDILDSNLDSKSYLTESGRAEALKTALALKKEKIDLIFASPLARTAETAKIVKDALGLKDGQVILDERLKEMEQGKWSGKSRAAFDEEFPLSKRYDDMPVDVESYLSIKRRVGSFLHEIEEKHSDKRILFVTHASPAMMLMAAALGYDKEQSLELEREHYIAKAEARRLDFKILPHDDNCELDLHRPYIDAVKIPCACGKEMSRVKEVLDVWFDSGSMPFAQDHYPFENEKYIDNSGYPADFISEAIDQTRGWFYTLHAIGALTGKGKAFKNVICLGHILDKEGKKMSKSVGNAVDPWAMMDRYGADALRLWMYSVNQPGDSKNFDEKTVDEINKKVFNLAANVLAFYEMYAGASSQLPAPSSKDILDLWILARLDQLVETVTVGLDEYRFFEPVRSIREFIADLSQWYIRRSRDRFKSENEEDRQNALMTTRYVLVTLAKVMAPFAPFFAEHLYKGANGQRDSVHLESWPEISGAVKGKARIQILADMQKVRDLSTRGLEARMAAKINVRQPLRALRVRDDVALTETATEILKQELNVKDIVWGADIEGDVELDLTMTPELKEEGEVRELVRRIQDLRKEKGLKVSDKAVLTITKDMEAIAIKNKELLMSATKLSDIVLGEGFGIKP